MQIQRGGRHRSRMTIAVHPTTSCPAKGGAPHSSPYIRIAILTSIITKKYAIMGANIYNCSSFCCFCKRAKKGDFITSVTVKKA